MLYLLSYANHIITNYILEYLDIYLYQISMRDK